MLSDRHEQDLAQILNAVLRGPSAASEARVLAVLAGVRPRRHPNLLTYIIVAALILLLAAGVFAAVRHFLFVEGTLQFRDRSVAWLSPEGAGGGPIRPDSLRVLSGELEWREALMSADLDPDQVSSAGEVLFEEGDLWPPLRCDIIKAKLDGSDRVNLTQAAGIGGVNCSSTWSPDGSMIAFQHAEPHEGQWTCQAGFHVWVMGADGSDAHRVTPEGTPPTMNASWSPDGSRLLMGFHRDTGKWQCRTITSDIWGTDIRALPNVQEEAVWSPDGSMIASIAAVGGELNGEPGHWKQLLLANADGSSPRVLVEQFIATAEIEARYPTAEMRERRPNFPWAEHVMWCAGPINSTWSPNSDKIAFLAAMPFDRDGPFFRNQIEVWIYDLTTDELIRITDDDVEQESLHWK